MRQNDSFHRYLRLFGELEDERMKASVASIDKRETVRLPNQITVDRTVLGKLNEMLVYGRDFHQEKNYQRRGRNPRPPGR